MEIALHHFYIVSIAFLIDLLTGDPYFIPHPVVFMGKSIEFFEKKVRKLFVNKKIGGFCIAVCNLILSFGFAWLIRHYTYAYDKRLGFIAECLMLSQMIAAHGLRKESMKVQNSLEKEGIEEARKRLSMIVGRDTDRLDEEGIIKATIETVAENFSDGVIAPIFYALIGGCPGAYLYKMINTMDSMIGYKDEKYLEIGRYAAKLDDIANFIPSRLSAIFLLIAGFIGGMDYKSGIHIFLKDRYKHASPNAAQTESVVAGLLGVELAGDAYYFGKLHKKEKIGEAKRKVNIADIKRSNDLMYLAAFVGLFLFWILLIIGRELIHI